MMRFTLPFSVANLPWLAASALVPFPNFVGNNGFGGSTPISAGCAAALNNTINCEPGLQVLATTNAYLSPNATGTAAKLCTVACDSSLTSYQNDVAAKCGSSSSVTDTAFKNTFMGDLLHDYYDLVCTKDPNTGQFCVDFLNTAFAAVGPISEWTQLPQNLICSPCQVSFFETKQRSPFLGYSAIIAQQWQETQTICGLNSPVGIDPASNLTSYEPQSAFSVPVSCASANTYTVVTGDTCQSIALANSVSQGTLWAINNLKPDCSAIEVGQSLCLPKQCITYTVQANDTCWSIATANGLTFTNVISYNPTVSPDCSNLDVGSIVCISNPQGDYAAGPATTTSGAGQSLFADSVVPAPGPVPFGTTTQCGVYYQVQVADTCERISLAAGTTVELFELINPSIDTNCFNLNPGLWYCVHPIAGWNTTSPGNSTTTTLGTLAPPAPTPPGTTGSCFSWHVIVSGDTCSLLQETLGVTMDQLVLWNPNLAADCSNLLLGEAYCVLGPLNSTPTSSSSTAVTQSAGPTTKAPPAPTPPGTTGSCFSWHVIVSGDNCFQIEQTFNITMAQLVLWNPNLAANCNNLLLGEAYCVAGPTGSTTGSAPPPTSARSSTKAPPAPTPPGTTGSCFSWHVVVSGDTCSQIEQTFGVTMAQLVLWNPNLATNCSNLLLGEAYCVSA